MQREWIPTLSSELPITIVIYRDSPSTVCVANTEDVIYHLREWVQSVVKPDLKRIMRVSMDAPFYLHLRSVDDVDGADAVLAACTDVIKALFVGWKLDVKLRVSAGDMRLQYPPRLTRRTNANGEKISVYAPQEV